MTITGGCLCGKVRYRIEAEPITTRVCWCRDCQYLGAGSGTVNVAFPSEKVHIEGLLGDYASTASAATSPIAVSVPRAERRSRHSLKRGRIFLQCARALSMTLRSAS